MSGLDEKGLEAVYGQIEIAGLKNMLSKSTIQNIIRAYLSALPAGEAGTVGMKVNTDIILAAMREYDLTDNLAGKAETMGRHAAVRGLMVRLGLYEAFTAALASDGDTLTSPKEGKDALVEPTSIDDILDATAARLAVAEWFKEPNSERTAQEVEQFKDTIRRELLNAAVELARPYRDRAAVAERDVTALRGELEAAKAKLFPYADATEISGMSWNGFYLIGDEKSIKELRRIENRSAQIDVFRAAFDERIAAEKARAETAEARLAEIEAETKRPQFPILSSGGQTIDFGLVADHREQARANHYQTVERLAERGGLGWSELYAVLHNRRWEKMDTNEAIIACRALEARYLAAIRGATQ